MKIPSYVNNLAPRTAPPLVAPQVAPKVASVSEALKAAAAVAPNDQPAQEDNHCGCLDSQIQEQQMRTQLKVKDISSLLRR